MGFIGEKVPAFIVNTPLRSYANISLEIHLREFTKACVVTLIGQKSNDSVLFFYDKDGMCLHVDIQVKNVPREGLEKDWHNVKFQKKLLHKKISVWFCMLCTCKMWAKNILLHQLGNMYLNLQSLQLIRFLRECWETVIGQLFCLIYPEFNT